MIKIIPTPKRMPFLLWYITTRGLLDHNQDMLDEAALLCSSLAGGCQGCYMIGTCQEIFDRMTDRNIEHW